MPYGTVSPETSHVLAKDRELLAHCETGEWTLTIMVGHALDEEFDVTDSHGDRIFDLIVADIKEADLNGEPWEVMLSSNGEVLRSASWAPSSLAEYLNG